MNTLLRNLSLLLKVIPACCVIASVQAQIFEAPSPEIVSAWKHNSENLVVIFRHDGIFYLVDGEAGHSGIERGTYAWNKESGAFSVNVVVDTNLNAGFSNPNGGTSITISGNTLTYSVTGEGPFPFTRIVNSPASAIVGSWYLPGEDANLTFLANGIYYHSQESDNEPDSTTGMERGTYTWNSVSGAFSGTPITDTNGDIGLSDPSPNPSTVFISGNVMTLSDGAETYIARRINRNDPALPPDDFNIARGSFTTQTSASIPPAPDYYSGESFIEDYVKSFVSTLDPLRPSLKIGSRTPTNYAWGEENLDEDIEYTAGWNLATGDISLAEIDAATGFPSATTYQIKSGTGTANLTFPSGRAIPSVPTAGGDNAIWLNGSLQLGDRQILQWAPIAGYDPSSDFIILEVHDEDAAVDRVDAVIQSDATSFDLRGRLTPGHTHTVSIGHVRIANTTTSGTGVFAGWRGHAYDASLTVFAMVAPGEPASVDSVIAVKDVRHLQTGPSTVILDPTPVSPTNGGAFGFGANVQGQNMALLPAPTVTPPPGTPSLPQDPFYGTLFFDGADDAWRYGPNANDWGDTSQAGIDARFPNGTYTFLVNGVSVPLSLTGNSYPNIPQLTLTGGSWINGKYAMDAANGITVTTNTFTGYGANADGRIGLGVNDSGVEFFRSSSPSTNIATYSVPAHTLPPNEITVVDAEFGAIVNKSNAIPGAYCAALYERQLRLEVHILPKIITQSSGRLIQPNESLNLQVQATGSPSSPGGSLDYEWRKNGILLPDEISPTLPVLSGSAASAGTYTCTISNAVGSATTEPIILEYADAYQAYAASFALNSVTSGAPDRDFDNDGTDNLLEFILGGSPTSPNPNLLKNATTTPAAVGRNLVFSYDRKTVANSITQIIETSSTLTGTWTPAVHGMNGVSIVTSTLDGQTERITATIPSTETKLFVRLKASR